MPLPITGAVLAFVAVCIYADLRTRRIPNAISFAGMLAGFALNALYFGGAGLAASLVGLAVTTVCLLAPFAVGGIGGGDVKMMGAVGSLLGPGVAMVGLGIGMVLGGLIAAATLAARRTLGEALVAIAVAIRDAVSTRNLLPLKRLGAGPGSVRLPYSVPLGVGTAGALAWALIGQG